MTLEVAWVRDAHGSHAFSSSTMHETLGGFTQIQVDPGSRLLCQPFLALGKAQKIEETA